MLKYDALSKETEMRILEDRLSGKGCVSRFDDSLAVRRNMQKDAPTLIRPAFVRDIDKIINCPYYNRYADKTQVFSFYKNDDIARRALHVQLVSRIARTIGASLGLNPDLIEAIALGHDIGHTPFGHAGERYLDELLYKNCGRHFSHNIHSVRVLDSIYPFNISLQTLSGIASHDGEMEQSTYEPRPLSDFDEFDRLIEDCYLDKANVKKLVPSTLEGCVVRISDIIAYLGKDRQDAERADVADNDDFEGGVLGTYNAEIIHNLTTNIVENSYGKPYIKMSEDYFEALRKAKADNYSRIYKTEAVESKLEKIVKPMMTRLFDRLLSDLVEKNMTSPVFSHHIAYVNKTFYKRQTPYEENIPAVIVADFIASMTDDYFIDLYAHLFPESALKIEYKGYFD